LTEEQQKAMADQQARHIENMQKAQQQGIQNQRLYKIFHPECWSLIGKSKPFFNGKSIIEGKGYVNKSFPIYEHHKKYDP